jgi:RNA polymerase sigma factor (sigma-70 family)
LRREGRFLPLTAMCVRTAGLEHCADPVEELAGAQAATRIRLALRMLPSRYREPIILCDLHDLSYEEAAAIVRTSVAAIRSRLHRGRRMLRDRLVRLERQTTRHPARAVRCST